jgi:hypothetical protein
MKPNQPQIEAGFHLVQSFFDKLDVANRIKLINRLLDTEYTDISEDVIEEIFSRKKKLEDFKNVIDELKQLDQDVITTYPERARVQLPVVSHTPPACIAM